jgi:hypothetical protein
MRLISESGQGKHLHEKPILILHPARRSQERIRKPDVEIRNEGGTMKPLNPAEQAKARKRFEASIKQCKRVKSELVAAAHAAEDHDMMPEYLWPDLNMDAWFHRKSNVAAVSRSAADSTNTLLCSQLLILTGRQSMQLRSGFEEN